MLKTMHGDTKGDGIRSRPCMPEHHVAIKRFLLVVYEEIDIAIGTSISSRIRTERAEFANAEFAQPIMVHFDQLQNGLAAHDDMLRSLETGV